MGRLGLPARVEAPAPQMVYEEGRVVRPAFDLREMAPEETRAIRKAGQRLLKDEFEGWIELAKLVALAGLRRR